MYTAYQGRVATARESYNNLKLEYDNMIKDAQLQNSAALAQLAYDTLVKGMELALEGFQYNNTLLQQQRNDLLALEEMRWNRRESTYNRLLNEQQAQWQRDVDRRDYATSVADSIWTKDFQERQFAREKEIEDRNYQLTVDEINRQLQASGGSSRGSSGGSSGDDEVYLPKKPNDSQQDNETVSQANKTNIDLSILDDLSVPHNAWSDEYKLNYIEELIKQGVIREVEETDANGNTTIKFAKNLIPTQNLLQRFHPMKQK
jgi:hypothetical protein